MPNPLVSAVVLNFRTPKETVRCVRALLDQSLAERTEILIADNHSTDDSIGLVRNTFRGNEKVRIVETKHNVGYGQGNDLAIRHARGMYILIINPDNSLEPDGLRRMMELMEKDAGIGIVGPKLLHEDGSIRESSRSFPTPIDIFIKRTFLRRFFPERMSHYLQRNGDFSKPRDVDWLAGACILFRKDLYISMGGFDPRFFLFFEDTDFCRRCWKAGKRVVYFPQVQATDRKHRLSEGGFFSIFTKWTVREHLRSALKYFLKWRSESLPIPIAALAERRD